LLQRPCGSKRRAGAAEGAAGIEHEQHRGQYVNIFVPGQRLKILASIIDTESHDNRHPPQGGVKKFVRWVEKESCLWWVCSRGGEIYLFGHLLCSTLLRQLVLLLLEVELGPGPRHGLSLLGDQPTQVVSLLLQTGPMLLIFR